MFKTVQRNPQFSWPKSASLLGLGHGTPLTENDLRSLDAFREKAVNQSFSNVFVDSQGRMKIDLLNDVLNNCNICRDESKFFVVIGKSNHNLSGCSFLQKKEDSMHKVEEVDYGIKVILSGFIKDDEAVEWLETMKENLKKVKKGFKVFVDMRKFKPASQKTQEIFVEIQQEFKSYGMSRSVVIVDNVVSALQLKRTASESGIYEHERYISPEDNANWEKQAMDWILKGIDPDK